MKKLDFELLLFLFTIGALFGTLYRNLTADILRFIPGSAFGCFVLILALDASMTASLFAWFTFPLLTLAFGAAAAGEASGVMAVGLRDSWRRLLILSLITPLHFLLSVWNIHTAEVLRGRGFERKTDLISFLLMSFAFLVCICLIYLRFQAKL